MEMLKHSTIKAPAESKYSYKFSFCFPAYTLARYEQYVFLHLEQTDVYIDLGNLCCKAEDRKSSKWKEQPFVLSFTELLQLQ